ncbi:MAG: hypothetical protein WCG47_16125 [Dermatophilaceae bacterium]
MRRRVDAAAVPPSELLVFHSDRWAPVGNRDDPWSATRAHEAWRAARAAWVAAGNAWPSDEDQRELEEAMCTPDEPWSPI